MPLLKDDIVAVSTMRGAPGTSASPGSAPLGSTPTGTSNTNGNDMAVKHETGMDENSTDVRKMELTSTPPTSSSSFMEKRSLMAGGIDRISTSRSRSDISGQRAAANANNSTINGLGRSRPSNTASVRSVVSQIEGSLRHGVRLEHVDIRARRATFRCFVDDDMKSPVDAAPAAVCAVHVLVSFGDEDHSYSFQESGDGDEDDMTPQHNTHHTHHMHANTNTNQWRNCGPSFELACAQGPPDSDELLCEVQTEIAKFAKRVAAHNHGATEIVLVVLHWILDVLQAGLRSETSQQKEQKSEQHNPTDDIQRSPANGRDALDARLLLSPTLTGSGSREDITSYSFNNEGAGEIENGNDNDGLGRRRTTSATSDGQSTVRRLRMLGGLSGSLTTDDAMTDGKFSTARRNSSDNNESANAYSCEHDRDGQRVLCPWLQASFFSGPDVLISVSNFNTLSISILNRKHVLQTLSQPTRTVSKFPPRHYKELEALLEGQPEGDGIGIQSKRSDIRRASDFGVAFGRRGNFSKSIDQTVNTQQQEDIDEVGKSTNLESQNDGRKPTNRSVSHSRNKTHVGGINSSNKHKLDMEQLTLLDETMTKLLGHEPRNLSGKQVGIGESINPSDKVTAGIARKKNGKGGLMYSSSKKNSTFSLDRQISIHGGAGGGGGGFPRGASAGTVMGGGSNANGSGSGSGMISNSTVRYGSPETGPQSVDWRRRPHQHIQVRAASPRIKPVTIDPYKSDFGDDIDLNTVKLDDGAMLNTTQANLSRAQNKNLDNRNFELDKRTKPIGQYGGISRKPSWADMVASGVSRGSNLANSASTDRVLLEQLKETDDNYFDSDDSENSNSSTGTGDTECLDDNNNYGVRRRHRRKSRSLGDERSQHSTDSEYDDDEDDDQAGSFANNEQVALRQDGVVVLAAVRLTGYAASFPSHPWLGAKYRLGSRSTRTHVGAGGKASINQSNFELQCAVDDIVFAPLSTPSRTRSAANSRAISNTSAETSTTLHGDKIGTSNSSTDGGNENEASLSLLKRLRAIYEACAHNRNVALHAGRTDLAQMWALLCLLAHPRILQTEMATTAMECNPSTYRNNNINNNNDNNYSKNNSSNNNNSKNRNSSNNSYNYNNMSSQSVSEKLMLKMLDYYERARDVQTLAMVACVRDDINAVFGQHRSNTINNNNNNDNANDSIISIVDSRTRRQHDGFRLAYAELLFRWQMCTHRAEVLKFNHHDSQISFKAKTSPSEEAIIGAQVGCQRCGALGNPGDYCHKCNEEGAMSLPCAVCQGVCRGLVTVCVLCGHGGHAQHLLQWFSRHDQCAVGCGCQCVL